MNPILIIGATGNIGRQVVSQLIETRSQVRALIRNPDGASLPPQVEVMQGDLASPNTLDACLAGIDTVFLVWTAPAASVGDAIAKIAKYARRVVFLSAPLKTQHPFFQQPNSSRILAEHVERTIESSDLEWTHLRPGIFALNSRHFWGPQIKRGDLVRWPYLAAPTAPIDERDIAAVAVRTLIEDGHAGMEYVITGPRSLSQREQISTIGGAMSRSLRIEEMSPEEVRREGLLEMPPAVVDKLMDAWAAGLGQPAFVTSTVEEVTGKPARTFAEWVAANIADFRA